MNTLQVRRPALLSFPTLLAALGSAALAALVWLAAYGIQALAELAYHQHTFFSWTMLPYAITLGFVAAPLTVLERRWTWPRWVVALLLPVLVVVCVWLALLQGMLSSLLLDGRPLTQAVDHVWRAAQSWDLFLLLYGSACMPYLALGWARLAEWSPGRQWLVTPLATCAAIALSLPAWQLVGFSDPLVVIILLQLQALIASLLLPFVPRAVDALEARWNPTPTFTVVGGANGEPQPRWLARLGVIDVLER